MKDSEINLFLFPMQPEKITLPLDIYYKQLIQINGVEFTAREVDVISCLLNRRATSISGFLLVGPRAVETYIRNIRQKAGGLAGREQIIDFIEKSDKFSLIKNEYYSSLRPRILFEEKLNAIAKKVDIKSSTCLLVYEKGQKYKPSLIPYLKDHLKRIGFEVRTCPSEGDTFTQPSESINPQQIKYVLYIFPDNLSEAQISQINTSHLSNVTFLLHQNTPSEEVYKKLNNSNYINLLEKENYYLSFFEILKKLLPHSHFESLVEEFKQQCEFTNGSSEIKKSQGNFSVYKDDPSTPIREGILRKKKWIFLSAITVILTTFNIGLFVLTGKEITSTIEENLPSTIRSDLILTGNSTLLNRPKLTTQIDNFFQKQQQDIQTIALIGIGGSGKTTLARQYARSQELPVVWEINAETEESIKASFENLADALSKTDEEKKYFKELKDIKNALEREQKIIQLVKDQLKATQDWMIIYDNVEKFGELRKYFPFESNDWGKGKIILTTRDDHIQSNPQIHHTIHLGELNQAEKTDLFLKIMGEALSSLAPSKNEQLKEFLKEIPSFPLDVSIAAYYLKTTNTSYERYLSSLRENNQEFSEIQENIIQEIGEYRKTRYKIISVSLEKLINSRKDFIDLLFFISLLDSNNIPIILLDQFKNKNIVDNFVYQFKKYSLASSNEMFPNSRDSINTISIHRDTQKIIFLYLIENLKLDKNKNLLHSITDSVQNYMVDSIDKENYLRMKNIVIHTEKFLGHELLDEDIKGRIAGELGYTYFYLGNNLISKQLLEESIEKLNKNYNKNINKIPRVLMYLGNVYREFGEYDKATTLLEKCLFFYNKNSLGKDKNLALALTYLAMCHKSLRNNHRAKNFLEKSLLIYKKNFSENDPKYIWVMGYLGNIYKSLGEYQKAKELLEKSLSLYQKYFPENYEAISRIMVYLAICYRDIGEYKKSKALLEKSLSLYKKYFPENQRRIDWVSQHLGNVYRESGELVRAKYILEIVKESQSKYLAENHNFAINNMIYLAKTYIELGALEKAKLLFEKVHRTYEKIHGKNHVETARILLELGKSHFKAGDLKLAEQFLENSLKTFKEIKHSDIYLVLESLAELYLKKFSIEKKKQDSQSLNFRNKTQSLTNQSIAYLKKALEILKTHFPEDSPHITRIQNKLKALEKDQN